LNVLLFLAHDRPEADPVVVAHPVVHAAQIAVVVEVEAEVAADAPSPGGREPVLLPGRDGTGSSKVGVTVCRKVDRGPIARLALTHQAPIRGRGRHLYPGGEDRPVF